METTNKNTYNSDITNDDLQALREKSEALRSDNNEDMMLRNREEKVDFTGKDLDIPGRQLKSNGRTKLKDEENQLYSQGGDGNEDLERNTNHIK